MHVGSSLPSSTFEQISIVDLETLDRESVDQLRFGVVGLSPSGLVEVYNRTESTLAGLPLKAVLGTHFFNNTAQCMNNYLVAQRFEDEAELDVVLDYVLTLRMRPTPVRLRLLKSPTISRRYVLIER